MPRLNRRSFLQLSATGMVSALAGAAEAPKATSVPAAPTVGKDVTKTLAQYLVTSRPEDVPARVKHEATRTFVNWLGVAVGGCRYDAVEQALKTVRLFAGPAQAQVVGRSERLDLMNATLINGISSHVLDFDDTHLKTIIHASSTVVPPALALAELDPDISGRNFLHALILGIETACRVGNAVYPDHYDKGWHITGTAGSIGAAATAGRLLGLNEAQFRWALGLAASQQVGLRESFGSMNKSFNPGRAGQNGLLAALLAADNFTSSDEMLEARRGWANTVSTKQDFSEITEGLGTRFETALNTYKPFACGIVIHPIIDGCIQLRDRHQLTANAIAKVELRVNPLVLELTGKTTPQTGLEGKFSVFHAAAIALLAGRAGPRQFSDEAVRAPATVALRRKVSAVVDPKVHEAQAGVAITLASGATHKIFVTEAVGSVEKPLSDDALNAKALDLFEGILPSGRGQQVLEQAWKIESAPGLARLAAALRT